MRRRDATRLVVRGLGKHYGELVLSPRGESLAERCRGIKISHAGLITAAVLAADARHGYGPSRVTGEPLDFIRNGRLAVYDWVAVRA